MSPRHIPGLQRRGRRPGTVRTAFSLVELLTVVGIIALLISILLPSMAGARREAKRAATKAFLGSCERGLEMFNTDFGQYPNSERRLDPLEYPDDGSGDAPYLSGAHWLARAMIGHDSNGVDYGAKSVNDPRNPALKLDLFSTASSPPGTYSKRRKPYVDKAAYKLDKELIIKSSDKPLPRRAVFIDAFEFPVLYYRSSARATVPFYEATSQGKAIYMQEDNSEITGGKITSGSGTASTLQNGWAFVGSDAKKHGMGQFGVNLSNGDLTVKADPDRGGFTFAGTLHNASAMKTSKTLKPVNESSFVLIAAGPDGLYGTQDDVSNFK